MTPIQPLPTAQPAPRLQGLSPDQCVGRYGKFSVIKVKLEVVQSFLQNIVLLERFAAGRVYDGVNQKIAEYLSLRDVVSLTHVSPATYKEGLFRDRLFTAILVERYYTASPEEQRCYRAFSSPFDQPAPTSHLSQWLHRHFTNEDREWVEGDILKVNALFRYLSNRSNSRGCTTSLFEGERCIACVAELPGNRFVTGFNSLKLWMRHPHDFHCTQHTGIGYAWVSVIKHLSNEKVAAGTVGGRVLIWDLTTNTKIMGNPKHDDGVCDLIQLQGERLMSACEAGSLKVWAFSKPGTLQCLTTILTAAVAGKRCSILSLTNNIFVMNAGNRMLNFFQYSPDTVKLKTVCTRVIDSGSQEPVQQITFLEALPNDRIISGGRWGRFLVWNVSKPEDVVIEALIKCANEGCVMSVRGLQDGRLVASYVSGCLKVWDLTKPATEQCVATLKHAEQEDERIVFVSALQQGVSIVSVSDKGAFKEWDMDSGIEVGKPLTSEREMSYFMWFKKRFLW